MALIHCTECGKEISDKAARCIHCGAALAEEEKPPRLCPECGNEIPNGLRECTYCGCPLDATKPNPSAAVRAFGAIKRGKKPLLIIAAVLVITIIMSWIAVNPKPDLNRDENLAYQNVVQMRKTVGNPDSFDLNDERIILIKKLTLTGEIEYTYMLFEYTYEDQYGDTVTEGAVFKDDKYIAEIDEKLDEHDPDYEEKHEVLMELNFFLDELANLEGWERFWRLDSVDVEDLKDKVGWE